MPVRRAEAEWQGNLTEGKGKVKLGSGAFEGPYDFRGRAGEGAGTNPEELLGAAHAGCFAMALSAGLTQAGHPPAKLQVAAKVHFEKKDGGFEIPLIELDCAGSVPGIDAKAFEEAAQTAKENCPLSKALRAVEIRLTVRFV